MKPKNLIPLILLVLLVGCQKPVSPYFSAEVSGDSVVIRKDGLTAEPQFINYTAEDVTIQLIAGRASDESCRLSLNTCQSCSPSPMAYFVYESGKLICMNCKNEFTMDDVGTQSMGCNPMPIACAETEEIISVKTEDLTACRRLFANWSGPME